MYLDLNPTDRKSIDRGDFPLLHDCILKVEYIQGSPLRFQFFTTFFVNTTIIVDILLKCSMIKNVKIMSVDKFIDTF